MGCLGGRGYRSGQGGTGQPGVAPVAAGSSKVLLNALVVDVAVCKTPEILARWLNQFILETEKDLQDERLRRSVRGPVRLGAAGPGRDEFPDRGAVRGGRVRDRSGPDRVGRDRRTRGYPDPAATPRRCPGRCAAGPGHQRVPCACGTPTPTSTTTSTTPTTRRHRRHRRRHATTAHRQPRRRPRRCHDHDGQRPTRHRRRQRQRRRRRRSTAVGGGEISRAAGTGDARRRPRAGGRRSRPTSQDGGRSPAAADRRPRAGTSDRRMQRHSRRGGCDRRAWDADDWDQPASAFRPDPHHQPTDTGPDPRLRPRPDRQ